MRLTAFLLALTLSATPVLAAEINIYSQRQPELIQPILDVFTVETGITVNIAHLDKGLTERLQAEAARSPADIILTVDVSRLAQAVEAGVMQPVNSAVLTAAIPAELRDPGNQWFGVTTRARVVYASKDRVAEGEVTTYEDLADPKWAGRICTRSGTHEYNLALMAAVIDHHGEDGARAWAEGVKANLARKPQGNDRAQVKAIWAGECDISLGNTYYMGQMLADPEQQDWANAVRIVYPSFQDGGTHLNVSGVAMTKASKNTGNALRFMEFLVSDRAQKVYAEINFEFPVKAGVARSAMVNSWGGFTPDNANLMDLAGLRGDALRIMEDVDFDG